MLAHQRTILVGVDQRSEANLVVGVEVCVLNARKCQPAVRSIDALHRVVVTILNGREGAVGRPCSHCHTIAHFLRWKQLLP